MIDSTIPSPPWLAPRVEPIPQTLKERGRWAPWRAEWNARRGKHDKVPYHARTGYRLSSQRPEHWVAFDAAWQGYEATPGRYTGIGWCLTRQSELVGVDLDHCVDDAGTIAPWAREVIAQLDTYTELSPSGHGVRMFGFGQIAHDWNNHDVGIEVYGGHEARFLTVTGAHLDGTPTEVQPLAESVLVALTARYAKERVTAEVIRIDAPELIDELALPDLTSLPLSDKVLAFLSTGECDGDRSGVLHAAGVALYLAGLDDALVYSLLASNEHAMAVAMDHRRQDRGRAELYLWREHCGKAKAKAAAAVASPDEFGVIGEDTAQEASGNPDWPKLRRNKAGRIETTVDSVIKAVCCAGLCGAEVGYDEFRDAVMVREPGKAWQRFRDHDYTALRVTLEKRGFEPVGRELIRDVVDYVAERYRFDSAIEWLRALPWDGTPRLDTFFPIYFGAEDTPYTRGVSAYTWTAMAGRVLEPGVKADMVPILVGLQGTVKSSGIEAMVGGAEWFTGISFDDRDDNQARRMRGKLLGEIPELKGLRTRDLESIKAFITRTHEHWVPKYREFAVQYPRRLVFIGTTNEEEFLADRTGNRRWLPMRINRADVAGIRRDWMQLWAEAKLRFEVSGVEFHQAEALAPEVHDEYKIVDPWSLAINTWLDEPDPLTGEKPRTREFLLSADVAKNALRIEDKIYVKKHENRICDVLRDCNYLHKKMRVKGKPEWVWLRPEG